jgi:hypothetical protein
MIQYLRTTKLKQVPKLFPTTYHLLWLFEQNPEKDFSVYHLIECFGLEKNQKQKIKMKLEYLFRKGKIICNQKKRFKEGVNTYQFKHPPQELFWENEILLK